MPAKSHSPAETLRTGAPRRQTPSSRWRSTLDCVLLTLATAAAFWPIVGNQFVNWDDPDVLLSNTRLGGPGVVSWAFSTTLIGHYQPLAWLIWSATKSAFGLSPAAFHSLSLIAHAANGLLAYVLAVRLAGSAGLTSTHARTVAVIASFAFALHPLRVEAVAWASAMPYVVSLTMVLAALIAYVDGRRLLSLVCYATALLVRASAIGLPLVLLLIDFYPLNRGRRTSIRRLVVEKVPFALVAACAAAGEMLSRDAATIAEVGIGARLTMAATAPFEYLARTALPLRLTPVNALPIAPAVQWFPLGVGIAALLSLTAAAWISRRRWPALLVGWLAYLVLLAPVAGLTPSGVQATADRYTYVPSVAISVMLGAMLARLAVSHRRRLILATAAAAVLALGVLTWRQTQYWNTSITLWTRAIDLDPRNDVASYNLAIALAEAGRQDEAIDWYERTIRIVPDHDLARQNLAILQAARAEREGNRLAEAGRLDEAIDQYARALALDAKRLHARAARAILLTRRGSFRDAIVELRQAIADGAKDPEVANSLAFALVQTGNDQEASAVLAEALAHHPDNVNLKHNLARLLATTTDPRVRNAEVALRLAQETGDTTLAAEIAAGMRPARR